MICRHCGVNYTLSSLVPHDCAGTRAALALPEPAPTKAPRVRRPLMAGDTVEWTERNDRPGFPRHAKKRGIVSRLVQNGKSVIIRTGDTLIELNMARVTRVAEETRKS